MGLEDVQRRFDRKLAKEGVHILRDANQWKVREDVFDEVTLLALYRFVQKKLITVVGGPISTGKEANVFYAEAGDRALALKIYMMRTANFKAMMDYIDGDPRFSGIRRSRKEIIFVWTRKEYANLSRARDAGVPVPEPIAFDRNILIMEFLGKDGQAFPPLKYAEGVDYAATYAAIVNFMKLLYSKANLVHADLSEFNILYGDRPYLIDFGQAVTRDHPGMVQFLERDVHNVTRFFSQHCDVLEERMLLMEIIQEKPTQVDAITE
ncbi:MAG: serine protein kinase RIO [Methanomicrobiales archaeon]|nr:serine protein kinase RIO [Methanomicrobiales archaeon]